MGLPPCAPPILIAISHSSVVAGSYIVPSGIIPLGIFGYAEVVPTDHEMGLDPEQSLGLLVARVGHLAGRGLQRRLHPLGLEPRQYRLMRSLGAEGGRSQQAVARELRIPASRMVGLVDDLETRGLLERFPNPSDRRAHALRLTESGRRLLDAARPVAHAYEAQLSAPFDELERSLLMELLSRMADGCDALDAAEPRRAGHRTVSGQ